MNRGIFMTPGREEEWTLSITHADDDVDRFVRLRGVRLGRHRMTDVTALAQRARAFVDTHCIPREVEAELAGGRLPQDQVEAIAEAARAAGLVGINHAREHGGQGLSLREQVAVHEAYGRNTNGVWWYIPNAANCLAAGTPEQIERYLRPSLTGERHEAYAITEALAGSDPSAITGSAVRDGDGWVLNAEKWFTTSGDVADFFILQVNAREADGAPLGPTLVLVDADLPGISTVDDPPFTHVFPVGHPTIGFEDVRVPDSAVLGGVGQGDALTNGWFIEERVLIAARCVGAMGRLLEDGVAWAIEREQFGARLLDHQGVSFPLADSACEASAARLMTEEAARLHDEGADPELVHAKASMAKLFASEAAGRVADRVVQVFGGRGYMRTNAARAALAGAARRPHLGGHVRDPAPDRGARARAQGRARAHRLMAGAA